MAKISRTFRLDDLVLDRLDKLVEFYNLQPNEIDLPGNTKLINKTDIIEYLINTQYMKIMSGDKK